MRRNAPFGDKSVRAFVRALTLTRLTGVDGIARQVYVRNATRRVPAVGSSADRSLERAVFRSCSAAAES